VAARLGKVLLGDTMLYPSIMRQQHSVPRALQSGHGICDGQNVLGGLFRIKA